MDGGILRMTIRLDPASRETMRDLRAVVTAFADIRRDQPWNDDAKSGLLAARRLLRRVKMEVKR